VRQLERAASGEHAVVFPVRDEGWLIDQAQVHRGVGPPPRDRDQLSGGRAERGPRHPIAGPFADACHVVGGGRSPTAGSGEEEQGLWVAQPEGALRRVGQETVVELADALDARRSGAGQDQPANQVRLPGRDGLGDEASEGEAQEVDLSHPQGTDEDNGVFRHGVDGGRHPARSAADTAVVEDDDVSVCGDPVDDSGVPVVDGRGEVVQQDERYAGSVAQLAVGEAVAPDLDVAGRCRRRGDCRRGGSHRVTTILPLALPCST
jgi:hypothetical protein